MVMTFSNSFYSMQIKNLKNTKCYFINHRNEEFLILIHFLYFSYIVFFYFLILYFLLLYLILLELPCLSKSKQMLHKKFLKIFL